MSKTAQYSGIAIALAWPETYCKQPGAWYDPIANWIGISKNNYYKVGHAALVLISFKDNLCLYFDFGRYHAPFQHGRVRSVLTDCDLRVKTKAEINIQKTELLNFKEILNELQGNKSCHGEGFLNASYCLINFEKAFSKAQKMQNNSPLPYGPFIKGSNCSRFVNTVIKAGKPSFKEAFQLRFRKVLTPTPLNNVNALEHKIAVPSLHKTPPFCPLEKLHKTQLSNTLLQPEKSQKIPSTAQWLSGEGAGSWFDLKFNGNILQVRRFSPDGKRECAGIYERKDFINMSTIAEYSVTYPSNCQVITLKHKGGILDFKRCRF